MENYEAVFEAICRLSGARLMDIHDELKTPPRSSVLRCQLRYNLRPDGIKGDFILRKSGNRQRVYRIVVMTQNMKQTIPAAIPVEDLAAHMPVPAPTQQMIWLGPNLQVPLDSVTLIDDDEEVAAAPPGLRRPERVMSPEVERRLAMYHGARSVSDVELEILMERLDAELDAGVVDDGDLT